MFKLYFVYILASQRNGTLYIGVTNDLMRRVWEHRQGIGSKFTKKYGVTQLVYFEEFGDIHLAIARETQLKKYKRAWKLNLIQREKVERSSPLTGTAESVTNWVARIRGP